MKLRKLSKVTIHSSMDLTHFQCGMVWDRPGFRSDRPGFWRTGFESPLGHGNSLGESKWLNHFFTGMGTWVGGLAVKSYWSPTGESTQVCSFFQWLRFNSQLRSHSPLLFWGKMLVFHRDMVVLRVKPQKPLCCKVGRPAVIRSNPRDGAPVACPSSCQPNSSKACKCE